ncbi:MAG: ATP-dependent helicase RecG [Patescibacteria group bacterium]|nr:ATP-dependent helicase RecG [Patescibacteria group bacterium]
MVNLDTLLKDISRITPKYAKTLEKMKLVTVRDFLLYFPFRYDDFSQTVLLSESHLDKAVTVEGKITKAKSFRARSRRMTITEIIMEDENNTLLKAVWFNQPYILESLSQGSKIRLSGKLSLDDGTYSMSNPAWEKSSRDATNTGRLVPVYPETAGITSKWIRWQMKTLLPLARQMEDVLPEDIRKKYHLPDIYAALAQIHFPDSNNSLLLSQKRMAFQEMFLVQLKALQVKRDWGKKNSPDIKFDETLVGNFVKSLPFKLTDAQRKASFEILKDLERSHPMNRLLNGDVGAGKTVVGAIAALQTISAGYQTAIMAPTEVLAKQHFESFCELFGNYDFSVALLTNSYKVIRHPELGQKPSEGSASNYAKFTDNSKKLSKHIADSSFRKSGTQNDGRKELLKRISDGDINLIIGTHALIQKDVKFKNLALVVIDEQHRFGVAQRSALQSETMNIDDGDKKTVPNLLTMTATPIPRTLSIAYFGSLDLSILDEMPKNRKPIITKAIAPSGQNKAYEFVRSELKKGRQAFVIFPLVIESEKMTEVKAATEEHKRLSEKIFPEFKLGLMHGKLKPKEKEETMRDFKNGKYNILVSTSVVEVGIDVPNATVMIIENAERFGLSQLHQFRGRVGRGEHQSYCFLFTGGKKGSGTFFRQADQTGKKVPDPLTNRGIPKRLKILEETNNGFRIAEEDLKLRGPGQFFGTLQSGLPDITMENLSNVKLIKFAREEAAAILQADPQLKKHPLLKDALRKFSEKIHLE